MEVAPGPQPRALFEQRAQEVLGGAGVGGGLQDHRGVRAQPGRERAGGFGDGAEVQGPVRAERGGGADHSGTDPAELGRVGGRPEAPREHPAQLGGGQGAVDRGAAGAEFGEDAGVGVMADGLDAGGGSGLGEGQAEVAESDDSEVCGHPGDRPSHNRRGHGAQALWTEWADAMSD